MDLPPEPGPPTLRGPRTWRRRGLAALVSARARAGAAAAARVQPTVLTLNNNITERGTTRRAALLLVPPYVGSAGGDTRRRWRRPGRGVPIDLGARSRQRS